MTDGGAELAARVAEVLAGVDTGRLSSTVAAMIERYRADRPAPHPILASRHEALAYAAYRMTATAAAMGAVLDEARHRIAPEPATMVDVGGGTGAATWAALAAFPSLAVTVVDTSAPALELGERMAARSRWADQVDWRRWEVGDTLPASDLAVASYLLGELEPSARRRLVSDMAASAGVVVLVEPGTPTGYRRVIDARTRLIELGMGVAAPCPHSMPCPLVGDWCHFAVRWERSALQRRLKGGELGYEDEKFSYVVASAGAQAAAGRIIRHPGYRKGAVTLDVCGADGRARTMTVGRSHADYRQARRATWGDEWR